jgi:hypothetical protein
MPSFLLLQYGISIAKLKRNENSILPGFFFFCGSYPWGCLFSIIDQALKSCDLARI